MLGHWCQLIAVGLTVAVVAVGIAGPTVDKRVLIGSLINLFGIGVGMWYLVRYLGPQGRYLGSQIRGAIATIRPLAKRVILVAALAPVAIGSAVHWSRRADAGTTVTPNVREFLLTLTQQDIQAMNQWSWSAYRPQDPLAVRDRPWGDLQPAGFISASFREQEVVR